MSAAAVLSDLVSPIGLGSLSRAFVRLPFKPRVYVMSGAAITPPSASAEMTELLTKIGRTRDKDAFATLFQYYAPRVKSYLIRQGASDATAEELAQEALLTVWRKADRFDTSKASAGTWIFTVARNLRIDALRKGRRPEFDPEDPAFVPAAAVAPDDAVQSGQIRHRIREALKQLPEDQATVIRLSFFEDKPHGEIADQLALPLGTVKSRLRLAMRRIRTLLGD